METVRKQVARDVGDGMEFVLSDATVDRMGDIVEPGGWELASFLRNPIALFGHEHGFPVGFWRDVRVDAGRLLGRIEFAAKGTSARIDEIRSLVEQGILRAVSVGFRPVEYERIDGKSGGVRFTKNELLEVSIVSVPANPAALSVARSMGISDETLSLAFGEQASAGVTKGLSDHGVNAAQQSSRKGKPMTTLSQRIENAQNELVAKRDRLTDLYAADQLDIDAVEALNEEIEATERALGAMQASEAKLAGTTKADGAPAALKSPSVNRRPLGFPQKDIRGLDLMVRAITARGIAEFGPGDKGIDRVLDERYPGHEATAVVAKADQTVGTTGVSGWASEIVQTAYADFMHALTGFSIYPVLRDRGIGLSFDGNGTVSIPSRTAGGAAGGFFAEGSPIRVGRITTAATTMTTRQMGVIIPFTRKLAMQSTPAIESLVRRAILEDTASTLDPLVLDAVASSTARPAGLLDGVSAVASGYGGGDHVAVREDFKALLAPFIAANAADNITVIMNPAQSLAISMMDGPDNNPNWFAGIRERVSIVESTHATGGRLIAIRNSDFATALGDAPMFDVSEQATIHMEDTTPLEIVSGTGPTVADPVRSLWQTGSIGIRMIMDISWMMRRTGMVQWIDGTSY